MSTARGIAYGLVIASIFFLGLSVGRGCNQPAAVTVGRDTVKITLPAPDPVHDTIKRVVWRWDTLKIIDSAGHPAAVTAICDSFDTTTPSGTRIAVKQCYRSDTALAGAIRAAIIPAVLSVQEPAPVERVVTVTKTVEVRRPINWTWEIAKLSIVAVAGGYLESRAKF